MPLNFELRRSPKHAIGEFTARLNFFQHISAIGFADAMNLAREVADEFELPAPILLPKIGMNQGSLTISSPHPSGYQRFSPEGEPVMSIQCDLDSITVSLREYDTWKTTLPLLVKIFSKIGQRYAAEVPGITGVGVQYSNEFRAANHSIEDARELFKTDSAWVAPFMAKAGGFWHCHVGQFEPVAEDCRYLVNINSDITSQIFPPESEARLHAKVLILAALRFDIAGQSPWVIADQDLEQVLPEKLEAVHAREKQLLGDVISDSYLDVMGEGANEYKNRR